MLKAIAITQTRLTRRGKRDLPSVAEGFLVYKQKLSYGPHGLDVTPPYSPISPISCQYPTKSQQYSTNVPPRPSKGRMTSPLPSSPTPPVPVTLDQALTLVQVNAWLPAKTFDKVREDIQKVSGADGRALLAHLIQANLLSKENASDLKGLMQHQATLPQFTFLKKLGAGGMGTVYLVQAGTSEDGHLLALKTINARLQGYEDFVGRFQRETTALAGLVHPHIATVMTSGESHGVCFMAMEYIDGPSLATLVTDAKVLPEVYVLNIMAQVADGLAYVYHAAKLVHRDIKPENILVVRAKDVGESFPLGDMAKLIDFGLVKPSDETDDLHLTQTGMTIGTPLYMSPEQIRGEELDCRSDIYGLAATMYHLLTGVTPFTGNSPGAIMSAHLTQPAPDPGDRVPGLHAMTRQLVMTGMAKKTDERFLTHEGFIAAIKAVLLDLTGKQGTVPRLLRKPLVLKNVKKKVASDTPPLPFSPSDAKSASGSVHNEAANKPTVLMAEMEPLSTRIANKHRHMHTTSEKTGETSGNQVVVMPALGNQVHHRRQGVPSPEAQPVARTASEMLRQVCTDRVEKLRRQHHPDQTPIPDEVTTGEVPSAIFHEDPKRIVGIGLAPWLVLAGSVLLLISYLALSMVGVVG